MIERSRVTAYFSEYLSVVILSVSLVFCTFHKKMHFNCSVVF